MARTAGRPGGERRGDGSGQPRGEHDSRPQCEQGQAHEQREQSVQRGKDQLATRLQRLEDVLQDGKVHLVGFHKREGSFAEHNCCVELFMKIKVSGVLLEEFY